MMKKCFYCKEKKATAFINTKEVCKICWEVCRHGDIEAYLKRKKKLKKEK